MIEQSIPRRDFLEGAVKAAILVPMLGLSSLSCGRKAVASKVEGEVPWRITIVNENEPGEPLIVSGKIYSSDGRFALPGINLYVYHTDATGRYSVTTARDNRNTRLHGLMRTDAEGRYEFRTIKPAPYPQTRNPSHIHAYVSGPGYPEYWIDEYLFADDPFVKDETRQRFAGQGSFSPILTLTRGTDGILRGIRNIKIERCSRNCTGN